MKNNWIGILTVGITLGTAWAVRGNSVSIHDGLPGANLRFTAE